MTDKNSKTESQKLIDRVDRLPECCTPFLLETGTERALSTRNRYAYELEKFFEWLILNHPDFCVYDSIKNIPTSLLSHVSSQDISRYVSLYKDDDHKERSAALKRNTLSSFFEYYVNNRLLEYNPVKASAKVKIHASDDVIYLNIEEQNRFLEAVRTGDCLPTRSKKVHDRLWQRDVAIVSLMLDTGMRVSELCGINIMDVNFEECSMIITRKGGKNQTLYFSDDTRDKIEGYLRERRILDPTLDLSEPLFKSRKGGRLTTNGVWRMVTKYAESALPGKGNLISPHKLRSSFAMELYRAKGDILLIQRTLGHKSVSTTNIYAKATNTEMKEARNILANIRNSV